ncbi:MAG: hypothetical protein COX57_02290 [Alphaproteobacteria bacterium CG_4_10_14_0_2_um_filter_63_37]|nr:MAG: hypothetical protein AUJ55_08435 [Proteobacteria bacterium CG1_02_64_396]PJA25650.1 MAG: hypothetical protein COX57_02290 [Alphaproteobacteria bacterium CG_4_10_14_0_2_um_filter_63_37]
MKFPLSLFFGQQYTASRRVRRSYLHGWGALLACALLLAPTAPAWGDDEEGPLVVDANKPPQYRVLIGLWSLDDPLLAGGRPPLAHPAVVRDEWPETDPPNPMARKEKEAVRSRWHTLARIDAIVTVGHGVEQIRLPDRTDLGGHTIDLSWGIKQGGAGYVFDLEAQVTVVDRLRMIEGAVEPVSRRLTLSEHFKPFRHELHLFQNGRLAALMWMTPWEDPAVTPQGQGTSSQKVTGPSLVSDTAMSAPKRP